MSSILHNDVSDHFKHILSLFVWGTFLNNGLSVTMVTRRVILRQDFYLFIYLVLLCI